MNTEQLRAEFEALESKRKGFGPDTLIRASIEPDDEYLLPLVQARWEGYQAGRAALQSQKPKGNDIMLSGVIRMPFEMAMADPISRMQFYQRAQQALNELEALQSQDRDKDRIDAERYRWLRADNAYFPEENHIWGGQELDEAIDHARRVKGE